MKKAGLDDGRKRKRGREGQNGGADVQEDADAAAGGAAGGAVDGAAPAIARQAKPRGRPKGKQTFATQPLQGSAEQQRRMTHASVSLSTSVLHTNAQIGDKGKFVLAFLPTGGKRAASQWRASGQNIYLVGASESDVNHVLGAACQATQATLPGTDAPQNSGWNRHIVTSLEEVQQHFGAKKKQPESAAGPASSST